MKPSKPTEDASNQLQFDLSCSRPAAGCGPQQSVTSSVARPVRTASVIDLSSARQRREGDADRALLDAVRVRAAHLTDCLLKR
jgi:hypothetical protein